MKVLRAIGIAVAVLVAGLLTTLAIPIETWRTGDQDLAPLTFAPAQKAPDVPPRLWIDTDAACGYSRRTDPDDCLAIGLLARASGFQIVGISTVFGNAPREVVDRTTIELVARLSAEVGRTPPVFSGSTGPLTEGASAPRLPAHHALMEALEEGPLTIVALGPLTNLAAVLGQRPHLASRVARLVAVMGRRPGHIFHPAEGAGAGTFFGHGPVFRDFNFVMDMRAAAQIVALNLPMSLIPYDAARGIEITASDLERLAESGGSRLWLAERARRWLDYWRHDIGRQGFYPFDLLAAAYVIEPQQFRCAPVKVWVGEDPTLFVSFWRSTALLVGQNELRLEKPRAIGSALYCAKAAAELKPRVMDRFKAAMVAFRDRKFAKAAVASTRKLVKRRSNGPEIQSRGRRLPLARWIRRPMRSSTIRDLVRPSWASPFHPLRSSTPSRSSQRNRGLRPDRGQADDPTNVSRRAGHARPSNVPRTSCAEQSLAAAGRRRLQESNHGTDSSTIRHAVHERSGRGSHAAVGLLAQHLNARVRGIR